MATTTAPSQLLRPKHPPYCGPAVYGIPLLDSQMIKFTKQLAERTGTPILRGHSDKAMVSRLNAGGAAARHIDKGCARIFPGAHLMETRRGLWIVAFVRDTRMDNSRIPRGEQMAALREFMVSEGFDEEPGWFRDS